MEKDKQWRIGRLEILWTPECERWGYFNHHWLVGFDLGRLTVSWWRD